MHFPSYQKWKPGGLYWDGKNIRLLSYVQFNLQSPLWSKTAHAREQILWIGLFIYFLFFYRKLLCRQQNHGSNRLSTIVLRKQLVPKLLIPVVNRWGVSYSSNIQNLIKFFKLRPFFLKKMPIVTINQLRRD
jgi:hypothetical protein